MTVVYYITGAVLYVAIAGVVAAIISVNDIEPGDILLGLCWPVMLLFAIPVFGVWFFATSVKAIWRYVARRS